MTRGPGTIDERRQTRFGVEPKHFVDWWHRLIGRPHHRIDRRVSMHARQPPFAWETKDERIRTIAQVGGDSAVRIGGSRAIRRSARGEHER